MNIRIDIPAVILGIVLILFLLSTLSKEESSVIEKGEFRIRGICLTNEILEDRGGSWWCVNPRYNR